MTITNGIDQNNLNESANTLGCDMRYVTEIRQALFHRSLCFFAPFFRRQLLPMNCEGIGVRGLFMCGCVCDS